MTRCVDADAKPDLPDTTLSTDTFKAPKMVGFSGGSVNIKNGTSKSLVSSTNGCGYSNGVCDDYDEEIEVESPVLSIIEAQPSEYGPHENHEEGNGDVSSSDGWENESNGVTKVSHFLKDPLQLNSTNEAIPLPAPPLYSGQANGGNSSYLAMKSDAVMSTQNSASYSNSWISPPSSRSPGDVGLTNLGNTCFLNSGLQCLLHSGGLVEYFLACKFKESIGSGVFSLLQSFQIVTQQVWSGQFVTIPLNDFRNILGGIHPQFKDGRQHDCQEFLGFTLDALHEQLKKWHAEESGSTKSICDNIVGTGKEEKCEEAVEEMNIQNPNDEKQVDCEGSFDGSEEVSSSTSPTPTPTFPTNIRSQAKLGSTKAGRKAASSLHSSRKLLASPIKNKLNVRQSSLMTADEVPTDDSRESLVAEKNSRKKPKEESHSDEETSTKKIKVDEDLLKQELRAEGDQHGEADEAYATAPPAEAEAKQENVAVSLNELRGKVDDYWNKHINENNTVIASTFQGIYKSTVICSDCNYVSITYEPFMYLSLPIPRITTKELKIKLVNMKDKNFEASDMSLTLNLTDNVAKLKDEVISQLEKGGKSVKACDVWASEVVNNYVSRYLEDNVCIRDIHDSSTNIYVFELNNNFNTEIGDGDSDNGPTSNATFCAETENPQRELVGRSYLGDEEDWDADSTLVPPLVEVHEGTFSDEKYASSFVHATTVTGDDKRTQTAEPLITSADEKGHGDYGRPDVHCCICLENDPNLDFRKHIACGCVVCKDCVKRGSEHYNANKKNDSDPSGMNYLPCPICMRVVEHVKEFIPFKPNLDPFLRMQLVTILYRCDSDTNNNSASSRLFGTPYVVRMPSCLPISQFNEFIERLNVVEEPNYKVVIVDTKGTRCAHCVYSDECHGCEISIRERDGNISLSAINTLAICYSNLDEDDITRVEPLDMMKGTPPSQLYSPTPWLHNSSEPQVDIYECLATFSESENLDQQNGWFCPRCEKNQCATKSMSVCKFPDYLIVYLKRFVFIDNSSIKLNNKLSFPLTGLDLKQYISEECAENDCTYDLYACVCHYGSASAGHYTAFGKNPVSQKWSYFNDTQVTTSTPGESDYSSAYVLFYQRKGVTCNIPAPETIKILSMHNPLQVACVVPYQNLGPTSSYLKSCPTQEAQTCDDDASAEVGLSGASSNNDTPHTNSCDSSRRLKSTGNILTNGHLEDEDQENHCPPKMVNGYESGDSDTGAKNFNLSRKGRRAGQNFSGGDSAMDS